MNYIPTKFPPREEAGAGVCRWGGSVLRSVLGHPSHYRASSAPRRLRPAGLAALRTAAHTRRQTAAYDSTWSDDTAEALAPDRTRLARAAPALSNIPANRPCSAESGRPLIRMRVAK